MGDPDNYVHDLVCYEDLNGKKVIGEIVETISRNIVRAIGHNYPDDVITLKIRDAVGSDFSDMDGSQADHHNIQWIGIIV